jgi:hypothetical protein
MALDPQVFSFWDSVSDEAKIKVMQVSSCVNRVVSSSVLASNALARYEGLPYGCDETCCERIIRKP